MRKENRTRKATLQKGSALIEFTLTALVWVPLLLGTYVIGMQLVRDIQASEIARDAGRLYGYGTNFSQSAGAALLQQIAGGFVVTPSGNAVSILSTVLLVGDADCQASGLTPSNCPNDGQVVFTQQVVNGNTSLRSSNFGTVNPMWKDSSGNIAAVTGGGAGYLQNTGLRVSNLSALITPYSGQPAFLSEVYLSTADVSLPGFPAPNGVYAVSIF